MSYTKIGEELSISQRIRSSLEANYGKPNMNHAFQQLPLVSIIINNYNYGRFLKEAIDSGLNQTYLHVEVIVVDDGSTDNSQEIITSYGNRIIPVLKKKRRAGFSDQCWVCCNQGK